MDDSALLQRFCREQDQRAFAMLVERYVGMVHAVNLRRTGMPDLSEELTQNVFATLARKARSLDKLVVLSGWLHRAAVLESARAMRAEGNRRRTMKAYSNDSLDDGAVDPLIWNDTLPILDEAIDQLDAEDREVVFLRFMEERTLKEIGRHVGKSESAVQRHVQRTLEKLSSLLRHRGVTASTAALAVSLSPELAKSAPAGLSPISIAQAAAPSSTSAFATTTALIMTRTTSLVIAGTLLALASTTGGLLLGKRNARIRAATTGTTSPSSSVATRTNAHSNDPLTSGLLPKSALSPFERIMKELVSLSASGELTEVHEEMRELAQQIESSDMNSALRYLDGTAENKANLAFVIFERWGQLEGNAACATLGDVASTLRKHAALGLALSWARADPNEAHDWYMKEKEAGALGQHTLQKVAKNTFSGSLHSDPEGALTYFESLDFDTQKVAIDAVTAFGNDPERADSVAQIITEISDAPLKLSAVRNFGRNWARHANTNTVTKWFDGIEMPNKNQAFESALDISEAFMGENPEAAMTWLWPKASEKGKEDLLEFVSGFWLQQDPAAAESWLKNHERNPNDLREP